MEFTNMMEVVWRRRLTSSAAYSQILIIFGISVGLFILLRGLLIMSEKWQGMMLERVKVAKEKRRNNRDNFRIENGYSWDYVMVFQVYDKMAQLTPPQKKFSLKYILNQLAEGGLETRLFYSIDANEVYCKIRAPIDRLMKESDRIDFKLPLEPTALKNQCSLGRKGKWEPVHIPEKSEQTKLDPYEYIYAKYEYQRSDVSNLYLTRGNSTIFRGVDRLKLIQGIIMARKFEVCTTDT